MEPIAVLLHESRDEGGQPAGGGWEVVGRFDGHVIMTREGCVQNPEGTLCLDDGRALLEDL